MTQTLSTQRIDRLRAAARSIVRELGFMQKGLAGTNLSPSAVHAIIELGYGTAGTASDLGALLHLEKSSVSRLVQSLTKAGVIRGSAAPGDKRSRQLALTEEGTALLGALEGFGRQQLRSALDPLTAEDQASIETGLCLFAKALRAEMPQSAPGAAPIELRQGYCTGVIAAVAGLHAAYYARKHGFGAVFERKVATEMSEFIGRIEHPPNAIFSAYRGEALLGSVSLDGEDLAPGVSHLRWFIVSPDAQGMGIGHQLLEQATCFVDDAAFERTQLWTFKGLDAARHLYEKHGFELVHETPGTQWGTQVTEQRFERKRASGRA